MSHSSERPSNNDGADGRPSFTLYPELQFLGDYEALSEGSEKDYWLARFMVVMWEADLDREESSEWPRDLDGQSARITQPFGPGVSALMAPEAWSR